MGGRCRKQGCPGRQEAGQRAQSFLERGARATGRRQGRLRGVAPEGGDREGSAPPSCRARPSDPEPEEPQTPRLPGARPGCAALDKRPTSLGLRFLVGKMT